MDIVDGISFDVRPGEVARPGRASPARGKSLTALAVMGLQPRAPGSAARSASTARDLLTLTTPSERRLLGHEMAMVYQDALSSLNPAMTRRRPAQAGVRRGGTRSADGAAANWSGLDPRAHALRATRTSCPAASGSAC